MSPFPAWVSCVNIPNMVQLRCSKMADGKALSSVSSDNEEPEQHQRDPIQAAIEKGAELSELSSQQEYALEDYIEASVMILLLGLQETVTELKLHVLVLFSSRNCRNRAGLLLCQQATFKIV